MNEPMQKIVTTSPDPSCGTLLPADTKIFIFEMRARAFSVWQMSLRPMVTSEILWGSLLSKCLQDKQRKDLEICLVSATHKEFGGWGRERGQTFRAVEVSALSCSAESRIPASVKNYQVRIVWKVWCGNINKWHNQQWLSVKKWATKTTCGQPWTATPEPQSAFITALSHHLHCVHLSWLREVLSILIPYQHQHLEDWYPGADKIQHINVSYHTCGWLWIRGNNCFQINDVRLEKW